MQAYACGSVQALAACYNRRVRTWDETILIPVLCRIVSFKMLQTEPRCCSTVFSQAIQNRCTYDGLFLILVHFLCKLRKEHTMTYCRVWPCLDLAYLRIAKCFSWQFTPLHRVYEQHSEESKKQRCTCRFRMSYLVFWFGHCKLSRIPCQGCTRVTGVSQVLEDVSKNGKPSADF